MAVSLQSTLLSPAAVADLVAALPGESIQQTRARLGKEHLARGRELKSLMMEERSEAAAQRRRELGSGSSHSSKSKATSRAGGADDDRKHNDRCAARKARMDVIAEEKRLLWRAVKLSSPAALEEEARAEAQRHEAVLRNADLVTRLEQSRERRAAHQVALEEAYRVEIEEEDARLAALLAAMNSSFNGEVTAAPQGPPREDEAPSDDFDYSLLTDVVPQSQTTSTLPEWWSNAAQLSSETQTASEPSPEASGTATCVICMDRPREYAIVPCGHRVLCSVCQQGTYAECPVCRKTVMMIVKVFL